MPKNTTKIDAEVEKCPRKRKADAAHEEESPAERKEKKHKKHVEKEQDDEGDIAEAGEKAEGVAQKPDWAALKAERKKAKLAKADDEAKKAKLELIVEKQKNNEALRKAGKLTKKEKYKANKAAKKAQLQATQESAKLSSSTALEKKKPEAAAMETLNPRAVSCFLTGLPYMATEKHIVTHFAQIGDCVAQVITDSATGRPSGKGMITFLAAEQASRACALSGSKLQNRWINVRLCEPRDDEKAKASRMEPGEKPEGCLSLVLKCDKSISDASIRRFFSDCNIIGVSCMSDKETGEFRGMAFLDFDDTAMVDKAITKHGQTIKGKPCYLRYKVEKSGNAPAKPDSGHQGTGKVAAHNRALPVPPPCGKATKFESDSDDE